MKGIVEERAVELGEYILENKATVRKAAKKFGVSKSTVHKDDTKKAQHQPWPIQIDKISSLFPR